jgi:hypothetical protein
MLKTKTERLLVLAVAFIAGCAASQAARTAFYVPEARAAMPGPRLEYYCLRATDDITAAMNKLGQQGWDLAAGAGSGSGTGFSQRETMVWCFKRPLGEPAAAPVPAQ